MCNHPFPAFRLINALCRHHDTRIWRCTACNFEFCGLCRTKVQGWRPDTPDLRCPFCGTAHTVPPNPASHSTPLREAELF